MDVTKDNQVSYQMTNASKVSSLSFVKLPLYSDSGQLLLNSQVDLNQLKIDWNKPIWLKLDGF